MTITVEDLIYGMAIICGVVVPIIYLFHLALQNKNDHSANGDKICKDKLPMLKPKAFQHKDHFMR